MAASISFALKCGKNIEGAPKAWDIPPYYRNSRKSIEKEKEITIITTTQIIKQVMQFSLQDPLMKKYIYLGF